MAYNLRYIATAYQPIPRNEGVPVISGTETVGQELSCTTGSWSGFDNAYTYQWNNDGDAITDATAATYTLQAGDEGHVITCTVTGTNTLGAVSATSYGTGAIAGA